MRPSRRFSVLTCATALLTSAGLGLSAGPASAAGAVFGNGAPGFTVSSAPAGSTHLTPLLTGDPDFAGEPSVGVSWKTGAGMYMAGTNTFKLGFSGTQVTWTDASAAFGLSQNLDPILTTEPRSGVTIAGGDTGACSALSSSTDDGGTWLPSVPCTGTIDHPTVGWSPSATTPGSTVFYYCQQEVLDNCATSTTGGLAWVPGANFNSNCLSLHGHLRGGPDGTAYLPNVDCIDPVTGNATVGGLLTTDDGLTWSTYTIPGAPMPASGFDPGVTVDAANTVYEGWNNAGNYHPMVAWSKDKGVTWSPHVDLASTVSPPLVASTFPTLVSGDAGRVAYSFLGTSAGAEGVDPFTTGFHGVWYAYTSYTYDGGKTWTTVRDTPTPLQYGEIDSGGTTTSGQRNLLDFIDSSVTKDGRVLVALADGCLADCEAAGAAGGAAAQANAEAKSTHAWATVAYQTAGRGLFAANDVVLAPSAPSLTATGAAGGVNLAWTAPASDGGAPITQYRIYRSAGGSPVLVGTPAGRSWTDTSAVRGTTYSYTVTAVNSAGESPASNAASASSYAVPGVPSLSVAMRGSDAQLTFAVADNGGAAITGYRVLRGTASGAETVLTTTTVNSLTDTGLTTGQTYFYEVVATNAAGDSPPSPEVAFSNATAPSAPTLTAAAGSNRVSLSWVVPANGGSSITGYVLKRGTTPGSAGTYASLGAVTAYSDTAVTPGVAYYYQLQAVNAVGTSVPSADVTATPFTTAGAPALSGSTGKGVVKLSWSTPTTGGTSISGYQIYRGTATGQEVLVQTISTGTAYVDGSVTGGTRYFYKVAAVTAAGTGALSNEITAVPK